MGPTGLWFVGFFFCHGSWLIWPWVVADLVDLVHGFFLAMGCGLWVFFLFGCGWWLQIEKWWKRKVVGLWLLWFVVVVGGATVVVIPLKQEDP